MRNMWTFSLSFNQFSRQRLQGILRTRAKFLLTSYVILVLLILSGWKISFLLSDMYSLWRISFLEEWMSICSKDKIEIDCGHFMVGVQFPGSWSNGYYEALWYHDVPVYPWFPRMYWDLYFITLIGGSSIFFMSVFPLLTSSSYEDWWIGWF